MESNIGLCPDNLNKSTSFFADYLSDEFPTVKSVYDFVCQHLERNFLSFSDITGTLRWAGSENVMFKFSNELRSPYDPQPERNNTNDIWIVTTNTSGNGILTVQAQSVLLF
jgi:hypothetical protein